MNDTPAVLDFDEVWDYGDPAGTRTRFGGFLTGAADSTLSYRLQLQTQIARTHGLEGDSEAAHKLLDETEGELTDLASVAGVRYLLERGRAHRSSGEPGTALPSFEQAYDLGVQAPITSPSRQRTWWPSRWTPPRRVAHGATRESTLEIDPLSPAPVTGSDRSTTILDGITMGPTNSSRPGHVQQGPGRAPARG
ncbi:MAG: hypothetical protein CME13_22485 [Gemmatimonadetes bacterium]|nr:hypothetical protein [Gemmatimonadota bacterium]MDP7364306.1 hypothetical protein [Candidatus Latescibacterota bacterium]HCV26580.1 hypothetical protein [Candidatus Latescibacterota bacterium]